MEKLEQFKKWIDESERIVFFGGAGVSTENRHPQRDTQGSVLTEKLKSSFFSPALPGTEKYG